MVKKLNIPHELVIKKEETVIDDEKLASNQSESEKRDSIIPDSPEIPSVKEFDRFRIRIMEKLNQLESRK
jgi:hypothetical protein